MIIPNGILEAQTTAGSGLDERGFPKTANHTWGVPVPCQFSPVKQNYLASVNGEPVRTRSFSILIEAQDFSADRVRLTADNGKCIGEFSVISVEPLEAVCQVRIIV